MGGEDKRRNVSESWRNVGGLAVQQQLEPHEADSRCMAERKRNSLHATLCSRCEINRQHQGLPFIQCCIKGFRSHCYQGRGTQ